MRLVVTYLTNVFQPSSVDQNGKGDDEWYVGRDWKGGRSSIFESGLAFVFIDWGKPYKASIRIAGNPAKIRTGYPRNTSLQQSGLFVRHRVSGTFAPLCREKTGEENAWTWKKRK